jgi:hypothetical protein
MALEVDAATANAEYSVAGRSVEVNNKPYAGFPEITGGGVTIEGQTYIRGTDGRILFLSRGIKTPQDLTSKVTVQTFRDLKFDLTVAAIQNGFLDEHAWMDQKITIVDQYKSGSPLAAPFTSTMIVSVGSFTPETPSDGGGFMRTIVWKQHELPSED